MTTVVNLNHDEYDVYIGRGSIWGNPFIRGKDGNKLEVIEKYKKFLLSNEVLLKKLETLKGKRLGCFCKPKRCHGDIIVEILQQQEHYACFN
jgi:hypothetical protein